MILEEAIIKIGQPLLDVTIGISDRLFGRAFRFLMRLEGPKDLRAWPINNRAFCFLNQIGAFFRPITLGAAAPKYWLTW